MDPGPTSITFTGVAIRRPESSLKNAYDRLAHDPLDPTADEASTVRVESGALVPAPPSLQNQEVVPIEVPSIFHADELRFALNGVLGKGGTSRVFAAFDHDLERELAIKVVPRQDTGITDRLAREARITAKISHPNVPPIFDVGTIGDDFFLALPLIRGRSLRFRIRQALKAREHSALPAQELVQVLLKVCDALSYAHARGIIHKDIKPDNIMVGEYGEVMVVDWGSAAVEGEAPDPGVAVGTPAYMAPEQAMGRRLDLRADVFALGATLFHALLLRKPLKSSDLHETIRRRMAGEFDAPSAEELVGRPRALVAVAQRAMSFNPSERYQTVGAFADGLRAYLAGGDSWSEPILDATFQLESWRNHWYPNAQDSFERRELGEDDWTRRSSPPSYRRGMAKASAVPHHESSDGHAPAAQTPQENPEQPAAPQGRDYIEWCLETSTVGAAFVMYPEVFSPRVAIDFEGTLLRGSPPGELTVVWTEGAVLREHDACRLPLPGERTYSFRVGAMANHVAGIFSGTGTPLATRSYRLHRGRPARIRVEIDNDELRLFVDDELLADHKLKSALGPGRFGLLAADYGKRFARVRVRERGTPGTVSALAIGDAFYSRGLYREAREEYERVAIDPGSPGTASELLYKRGLCFHQLEEKTQAEELWAQLSGPEWTARVSLHHAETSFRAGDREQAIQILRQAATGGRNAIAQVKDTWIRLVQEALDRDETNLEGFLLLREDLFPLDLKTRSLTARILLAMGEFTRVLEDFSKERFEVVATHLATGHFEKVEADLEVDPAVRDLVFLGKGEFERLSTDPGTLAERWVLEGKIKEALTVSKAARILLSAGENELALTAREPQLRERVTALVRVGRGSEALQSHHPLAFLAASKSQQAEHSARSPEMRLRVHHYQAVEAFLAGDREKFSLCTKKAAALPFSFLWDDMWFDRYFLLPLCREHFGESGIFDESLRRVVRDFEQCFAQRAYYMAGHILGRISDKEFLAQPAKGSAPGRLYLARAIKAEFEGQTDEAARAYTVFSSLKRHHRFIDSPLLNPSLDLFCEKRVERLR
jgi:serine/threonine protein kinase/tetratricopeptide (TPR) repeat protein